MTLFTLGTNQGLYHFTLARPEQRCRYLQGFNLVKGTEGQVWALESIDNTLYVGHDRGLFVLRENTLQELSTQ
jgi:AraC family transcriptional regulator, chitin signaling transcriptional activator